MKAVTEFASFTLTKGLKSLASLTAEGKSPEEIQTSLGETFKLEGDKLGYFVKALEVAGQNTENLKRVVIVRLNEGEAAPAKATQAEELYYIPEFLNLTPAKPAVKADGKGGRGGPGGNRGGGKGGGAPKSSPWGISPEELAAKNAARKNANKAT